MVQLCDMEYDPNCKRIITIKNSSHLRILIFRNKEEEQVHDTLTWNIYKNVSCSVNISETYYTHYNSWIKSGKTMTFKKFNEIPYILKGAAWDLLQELNVNKLFTHALEDIFYLTVIITNFSNFLHFCIKDLHLTFH